MKILPLKRHNGEREHGGEKLKEFTKTKQLQSSIAVKEEMVEKGPKFKHFLFVLFWAHCHRMAFSLLHRKEWI